VTASREATVLCVDPTGETAGAFDGTEEIDTLAVETAADAREAVENRRVDCVVAEYDLSDATGFELFDQLRETQPNLGCILYTATAYGEMGADASGSTVAEYVPKSGSDGATRLVETVRSVVGERTQAGFPLPPEEDQRLATLAKYDVPDLETTETFDRISRLVASHFDVTVAFVGLIDEYEERFLTCHGADWERLSREDTICTYAMLEEDVTVIEDVQADSRFEHNETLRALGIRSYAGATIAAPNGQAIGQLCVTNEQPRSYTDEEQRDLQLFADEVAEQLELRRRLREAEETDGGEQP
jgi:CheY-like chemotaxis protein